MATSKKSEQPLLNPFVRTRTELRDERARIVARLRFLEERLVAMKCLKVTSSPLPLRRVIEIVMKDEALTAKEVYARVIKFGFGFRAANAFGTVRSTLSRHFKLSDGKYSRASS